MKNLFPADKEDSGITVLSQIHGIPVPPDKNEIQTILRHPTTVLLNPIEAASALKPVFPPSSFFHRRDHKSVCLLLNESGWGNDLAEKHTRQKPLFFQLESDCTAGNANTKEGTKHRYK